MATRVHVPSPLRSYTGGAAVVPASGATVGELLADLDRRHKGMRFRMIDEQDRIRTHIKIFVNGLDVATIGHRLAEGDNVTIICALSGG
ncbi:MAG TPA: MoaD/ThiS family protein [Planctomycetota bacterium]|jgi:molybdopterin synthase sulfur carrier subunit|nr:MoaD/ThiS family protein [Planctomycetota bacterium]